MMAAICKRKTSTASCFYKRWTMWEKSWVLIWASNKLTSHKQLWQDNQPQAPLLRVWHKMPKHCFNRCLKIRAINKIFLLVKGSSRRRSLTSRIPLDQFIWNTSKISRSSKLKTHKSSSFNRWIEMPFQSYPPQRSTLPTRPEATRYLPKPSLSTTPAATPPSSAETAYATLATEPHP